MARIVVAGAGATGASIAYHLALEGASDVVLADRGEIAGGATGKAMGGIRQQFSTFAEVRLARESIRFFEQLGPPFFEQVGYLFLAASPAGMAALDERRALQAGLGVPVERLEPDEAEALAPGIFSGDLIGGVICREDGVADPRAVAVELVRRAEDLGVEVREHTPAERLDADICVLACGAHSAEAAASHEVDLPVKPLCRQLFETSAVAGIDASLPMVLEAESGLHFRRRGDALRVAMPDPEPRWGFEETVDESLLSDRLERLVHRFPAAAPARVGRAWAGLYDMTPDAHPIIGFVEEGVYAACGFSGHGFMQSPAVGRAVAEEILHGASHVDLSPYRLERFSAGAVFPEAVIL